MQSAPRSRDALRFAGLMPVLVAGCENTEVPLAEVPRAAQPDPVPLDKLPEKERPGVAASARAATRFDLAKPHGESAPLERLAPGAAGHRARPLAIGLASRGHSIRAGTSGSPTTLENTQ